ncbi:MAG: TonB-dependent receptor plug domain-containing protein [Gemmatimonadetes bacterium]|nr:TonB-dependent receptor plug domain-containing protein [Gemmatimonadota bacterium]
MWVVRQLHNVTPVMAGMAFWGMSAAQCSAQDPGRVAGRVVSTIGNEAGSPVSGVTLRIPGLGLEIATNDEGRFDFGPLPAGRYEISAEILGCQLGLRAVEVANAQMATVDFVVSRPVIAIPGLVASGLAGQPPLFDPPYAVGRLDRSKLRSSPGRTIADLIRGQFPGAKIVQGSGLAGSEVSIQFRGRRSIATAQEPLIVVDGVITGGGSIDLNPRDVEDIVVLRGSAAAAHYGSRGQAGVIEITTRRNASRGGGRSDPWVIVDGSLWSKGLEELDRADMESMELVGPAVAQLLFGRGAPEAGIVRIRTREGTAGGPPKSCFEPVVPSSM